MFSFMMSSTTNDSAPPALEREPKPEPEPEPTISMFGGMDVPDDTASTTQSSAPVTEAATSSFSFMQTIPPHVEQQTEEIDSGFSFLSATQATNSPPTQSTGSSFSFMSSPPIEASEVSSFSFLSQPNPNLEAGVTMTSEPNYVHKEESAFSGMTMGAVECTHTADPGALLDMHMVAENIPQGEDMNNIKLAKTALAKQVKKKKRATKVGFGREDDEEEGKAASSAPTSTSSVTPTISSRSAPTNNASSMNAEASSSMSSSGTAAMAAADSSAISAIEALLSEAEGTTQASTSTATGATTEQSTNNSLSSIPEDVLRAMDTISIPETQQDVENRMNSTPSTATTSHSSHQQYQYPPSSPPPPPVPPSHTHSYSHSLPEAVTQQQESTSITTGSNRNPSSTTLSQYSPQPPQPSPQSTPSTANIADGGTDSKESFHHNKAAAKAPLLAGMGQTRSGSCVSSNVQSVTVPASPSPRMKPASPSAQVPATAPAPAVVATETTTQKLERKSREILAKLVGAMTDLSRLHASAVAGQERFRIEIESEEAALNAAKSRRENAENDQARLAQMEEFEQADALNSAIALCDEEIRQREASLRDLKVSVRLLETTFAQERADAISGLRHTASSLKALREQLAQSATLQTGSADKQYAVEQARIAAELERIGLEKGHFEREEEALSGDSERTEEAIRAQTGDLCARKEDLTSEMSTVQSEISALQEQLAMKMAEQAKLAEELDSVDGRIGEVRKKYDRQLLRIADRQTALQQSKSECLEEERAVLRDLSALEAQAEKDKASSAALKEWVAALEVDTAVADLLLASLTSKGKGDAGQGSSAMASIGSLESSSEDPLTSELRKNADAIIFLTNKKQIRLSELQSRQDELMLESRRLAEQVSVLDAEKKVHAAAKRFKEAAAVAKELKELQGRKENDDSELAEIETAIQETSEEIVQLGEQQAKTEAALSEARRDRAVAKFEELLQRAHEVRQLRSTTRAQVAKVKETNRSMKKVKEETGTRDAREGDREVHMHYSVLDFLSSELDAVLREARLMKEHHGLDSEVPLEDVEDVEDADELEGADGESTCLVEQIDVDTEEGGPRERAIGSAVNREESYANRNRDADNSEGEGEGIRVKSKSELDDEAKGAAERSASASGAEDQESTPQEDDDVADDVAYDIASKDIAGDNGVVPFDRAEAVALAKKLIEHIDALNQEMDEASDLEDYELAARLFDEISASNSDLEQKLN